MLKELRTFLAIARSGQIGRAGKLVGLDPTTVGRHLRRLETSLGQTLFEHQHDGQRLTESGSRLLVVAEDVERRLTGFSADQADPGTAAGLLRVSASEGFGTWFIARHLADFARERPAVTVDLVASSGFLSPSKRETDVAVLLARPRKGPLITRKLTDYGLRLYAAHDYAQAQAPIQAAADLGSHALVGYIPDFVYAPELHYLDEVAPGLEPRLRSSSINAQYRLIRSGAGIGMLPCFIGDADPALTRLLPDVHIIRSFWLVTHRDTRNLPRVRQFADWLGDLATAHRRVLIG